MKIDYFNLFEFSWKGWEGFTFQILGFGTKSWGYSRALAGVYISKDLCDIDFLYIIFTVYDRREPCDDSECEMCKDLKK